MANEISPAISVNIQDEMRQSYMDYAMSVIIGRALPDVRDGMKPVQRRILYAMFKEGLLSSRKHSKCAGVVGEVLKKYHPHGDASVYDALVRLAQTWVLRYPLINGQGNFGSMFGDSPAAYRYTECRLMALAERMLQDIDKDTVPFTLNFDESTEEPLVLPTVIPQLLVNGADGIAVGMATHMPPHNLKEVIEGALKVLENPQVSIEELMQVIPGPDFPTGGIIYGKEAIRSAYHTGKGILQIRAKTHVEQLKSGSREVEAIIVTEVPFQVNAARLLERIAELVNEKQIEGVSKLRDESDRTGIRIVMEVKKDATTEVVLNQLFALTPLQVSFGIINLAIVEGQPIVCTLRDLLQHFISHRRDIVTRRTEFDLRKALERMHILEGFRIALLNLDAVIALIRGSETPALARAGLMTTFSLAERQADAILELRLQKLTGLERLAIEQEHKGLAELIEDLKNILSDTKRVDGIIKTELITVSEDYGDVRRTQIIDKLGELLMEDLIEDEDMVVSISHQGYMKRQPLAAYKAQRRGGKGITGASQRDEDFIEHLFVARALSDLLFFTNRGRLYWLKVHEVTEAGRAARGRAIINLLQLKEDESVTAILPVNEYKQDEYVVMATRQGVVKKVEMMEFSRSRKSGLIACTLDDGDVLVGASVTKEKWDVILATKQGMAIRFDESDVRAMGRNARGVRGITLDDGDAVVGMAVTEGAEIATDQSEKALLTVCEHGYGKRTVLTEYRSQSRGGKGVIDIKTEGRNGPVVGVGAVSGDSEIMLITSIGKVVRLETKGISLIGRNTMGVTLVGLEENESVVAVSPFVGGDVNPAGDGEGGAVEPASDTDA